MHVLEFALKHVPMFPRTSATNTLIMSVTLHATNQIGLILCLSLNIWLLLMPTWYESYEELNDMVKTFRLSLRLWNQACNLQLLFLLRYGTAVSQESLSLDCPLGEGILAIVVICVSWSGMLHGASFVIPLMKNEFSSGCSLRLSCQLLK